MNEYSIGEIHGCRELIDVHVNNKKRKIATVRCVHCNKTKDMYLSDFISYRNISCRCRHVKHGMNRTKIYSVYANIKYRCYNENHHEFYNYGGKGIRMCDEWLGENGFSSFYKWALDNGYKDGLTIDRIDENGNYEPSNCQWITRSENTIKANKTCQHRKADNGTYFGISPNGEYYEFDNAAEFGRNNNLSPAMIRNVANGKNKIHKGWRFGFVNEVC